MRIYYLNEEYEAGKHKIVQVWGEGLPMPEEYPKQYIKGSYSVSEIDERYNRYLASLLLVNRRIDMDTGGNLPDRYYINNSEQIVNNDTDEVETINPNPQKEAYKLSQLYGLTHEQLDTYIDGLDTMADFKEAFRKALHVILWLVKQTKLDE